MKICIDPGHGGHDPGATFNGALEKNKVLAIGRKLARVLLEAGHDVFMTRSTDVFVGITERCKVANAAKADIFVSLHCNADPDPDLPGMYEARGQEIWIYPGSKKGRALAEAIAVELRGRFPDEPFRGIKSAEFGVLRMTAMPAVLIEMGFIDHSETVKHLADPIVQERLANAIMVGIEGYREEIGR